MSSSGSPPFFLQADSGCGFQFQAEQADPDFSPNGTPFRPISCSKEKFCRLHPSPHWVPLMASKASRTESLSPAVAEQQGKANVSGFLHRG